MKAGSLVQDGSCKFIVWAPEKETMLLQLVHPYGQELEMTKDDKGYFSITVEGLTAGAKYRYKPNGGESYPDPASHFQPEGVHGPSQVVDHQFSWSDDNWRGIPFKELIIYELHVGTFTPEGTFTAIIPHLNDLVQLGINAIELMPVAQFPGDRNWGYDAVFPYAVQNSYGGPAGLKQLVDACHQKGIAVFVDVVYNHLGPEGNYLSQFGPYFNDQYKTPWGGAINFDGDWSDGVREYFCRNMLYWLEEYHIDGLRCDAIHMVFDNGAIHFWEMCYNRVKETEVRTGRRLYLTAESDMNSPRVVQNPEAGGYGFDAQWLDDFHHALYVMVDEAGKSRYEDFGKIEQLAKAYTEGFVHSGDYVAFRKRKHGRSSAGVPGDKFIVFNQNHDQVGNRVKGERLSMLVDFERQKLAAAAMLLAPYVPLIFMGEEYSEQSPFFYFVSHSDPDLIKAVQEGRKKEFEKFEWNEEPPDPQNKQTFQQSKLQWHLRNVGRHNVMLQWFTALINLRKTNAILQNFNKKDIHATVVGQKAILLHRQSEDNDDHLLCLFNFSDKSVAVTIPSWSVRWQKIIGSKEAKWTLDGKGDLSLPAIINEGEEINVPGLYAAVYGSVKD